MAHIDDLSPAEARNSSDPNDTSVDQLATTGRDGDNKFQSAILAWRNIDLTAMIPTLDNTASEIVQYQRDSTVQRKDLAQKTKDFRKLEDTAKLGDIKSLLKAYQTFIDLLANHSKNTNSAFLQVYSSLSEAPDPYPLLEASVDSLLLSEDTLPKISKENEHLQEQVVRLTTQLEETESRLASESKARRDAEECLESRVKHAETSWAAAVEEKQDNWDAKERLLEEKIDSQERLLSEIKASYEVNQRLGQSENDHSNEGHVTSAELEMVNSDLERTSVRLAEVEARNEQLRIELAQLASQVPSQAVQNLEDDPAYLRMRLENASLMRKLDATRVERDSRKREVDNKFRALEREVSMLNEERDGLRYKLSKWNDYDQVKQELDVLKIIEFSTGEGDYQPQDSKQNLEDESRKGSKGDTLEQLLLARNKKLVDEMTMLRMSHQDLQDRLDTMQEEMSQSNAELQRLQNLNATLENDLATVQEGSNAFPSGASVAGTYANRYQPSTFNPKNRRSSPTLSIISGFDPRGSLGGSSLEALRSGEPVGGGSGILPMITAQRDRFKKRNSQLENELSEGHGTITSLRQEIASLQKDNLNLYEKTRYISTYNRSGQTSSSASTYNTGPNPSNMRVGPSSPPVPALDRYRSAYESNISPFASFRGRESVRAYKGMSLPERIVFSLTRMILSSRTKRNLFAGYCVVLHMLIFVSLYWLGAVDVEQNSKVTTAAVGGVASKGRADQRGHWHEADFNA